MDNAIEPELEIFQSGHLPARHPSARVAASPSCAYAGRLRLFGLVATAATFLSVGPSRVLAASQRYWVPKAPDFSTMANDGQTYSPEYLKGSVVLLYFWATWCPYCRKAVPHMNDLANEYASASFTIIGICGSKETESWRTYINDHRM